MLTIFNDKNTHYTYTQKLNTQENSNFSFPENKHKVRINVQVFIWNEHPQCSEREEKGKGSEVRQPRLQSRKNAAGHGAAAPSWHTAPPRRTHTRSPRLPVQGTVGREGIHLPRNSLLFPTGQFWPRGVEFVYLWVPYVVSDSHLRCRIAFHQVSYLIQT